MPLELRKTSQWWYGRYNINGKVHCINLDIPVDGTRPPSISQEGDAAFERSKGRALEKFKSMVEEARNKRDASEYVQKLHMIRTGHRIHSIALSELPQEWAKAPRKRTGCDEYVENGQRLLKTFVDFCAQNHPKTETMADVTPEMAEAFMTAERDRGVTGRTFNQTLTHLRSAFKLLARKASIASNPFADILCMEEKTNHRQPFTMDEVKAILKVSESDEYVRPIIITGLCTAMRRGDCCTLKWSDVDCKARFVRVKTSKTGETVEVPMFQMLHDEIQRHVGNGSEYVFPEQAKTYQEAPQSVSYRIRRLLAAAGFYDEQSDQPAKRKQAPRVDNRVEVPADELMARGLSALDCLPEGEISAETKAHMKEALKLYVSGRSQTQVARDLGISKAAMCNYLHEIETLTGLKVVRDNGTKKAVKRLGDATADRGVGLGLRRASVHDFHSFRVTWITLALAAGVPMELVTRVTGHQTVDVVLKHYFRPGREDFRRAIENAMPKLLTSGNGPETKTPKDQILEICNRVTEETWKQDVERIAELAAVMRQ